MLKQCWSLTFVNVTKPTFVVFWYYIFISYILKAPSERYANLCALDALDSKTPQMSPTQRKTRTRRILNFITAVNCILVAGCKLSKFITHKVPLKVGIKELHRSFMSLERGMLSTPHIVHNKTKAKCSWKRTFVVHCVFQFRSIDAVVMIKKLK